MSDETTTIEHRARRAAALLIEQGYAPEIATVASGYTRARCWWEAQGEPAGGLAALRLQVAADDPRIQIAAEAMTPEHIVATERVVDGTWHWICSSAPIPPGLPDPAQMNPLDVLEEQLAIEAYVAVDAR